MKSNEDFHSNEQDCEYYEPIFKICHECDGEKFIRDEDNVIDGDIYIACENCRGEGELELDQDRIAEIRWAQKHEREHDDYENYD